MRNHPTSPRLAPLAVDDMTADQRELVGAGGRSKPLNIFATLVRAPGLYRRWSPFGGKLLRGGKLSERDREIVILRTAFRWEAPYEWGQHVGIGREAGLTDDEMLRIAAGPDERGWSAHEAALVRAVDELHDDHGLSDATWATLAETYHDEQMLELLFLSGHYALLAGVLNSCGVQPEGPLPALGTVGESA